MKFTTTLKQGESKNVVGIVVPPQIVEALGGGKRPPVKVTINGYAYLSTIAVMGGDFMVGVAAEHRAKAKVAGGDTVEIQLELDASVRTVETPADLAAALKAAGATAAFEALAFSHRKEHVRSVNEAKAPETRQRRIEAAVQKVLAARK
ncbi:MAG: YdeI/OmpD-associated family protein [Caulobacterales bacterium]